MPQFPAGAGDAGKVLIDAAIVLNQQTTLDSRAIRRPYGHIDTDSNIKIDAMFLFNIVVLKFDILILVAVPNSVSCVWWWQILISWISIYWYLYKNQYHDLAKYWYLKMWHIDTCGCTKISILTVANTDILSFDILMFVAISQSVLCLHPILLLNFDTSILLAILKSMKSVSWRLEILTSLILIYWCSRQH